MFNVVEMLTPGTTDAGVRTSDVISLKNVVRAWLICSADQGGATAVTWTPMQAVDVAITGGGKVLTNVVPIRETVACATSDVMANVTAAKLYATAAAVKHSITVFQIDPDVALDVDGGYDCLYLVTLGAQILNLLSVVAILEMRYEGDTMPSVIVD
jgi:hypothetical protein